MIIRIGTRGSRLALAQAELVKQKLAQCGVHIKTEIVPIITSGDNSTRHLSEIGGKELFTKEIEEALINNNIDIAVHSMKDIPAFFHKEIVFGAFLERDSANDVFISNKYNTISEVPIGGDIGTSSVRRGLQLSGYNIVPIRGNVETRIKKCENLDGIILAHAGLKRLNLEDKIKQIIPYEDMMPSIGQGMIAIHILKDNIKMLEILRNVTHHDSEICAMAERAFVEKVNGNCRTPMGGICTLLQKNNNKMLAFKAMLATQKGMFYASIEGNLSDAKILGEQVAEKLISDSGYILHHL